MESLEKWFAVVEKHVKQFEGPDANTETELSKLQAASTLTAASCRAMPGPGLGL